MTARVITLTTPGGDTITGTDEIELASNWLDHQHGPGWEASVIPPVEHETVWSTLEELDLMRSGHIPGYTITEH